VRPQAAPAAGTGLALTAGGGGANYYKKIISLGTGNGCPESADSGPR
jgi:hypothetical protein